MNKSQQQPSRIPRPISSKNSTSKMVSAPVAKAKIEKITKPKFSMPKQSSDGRVCIRHREYISDIFGSVNFSAIPFSINPGLAITFPWLSTISIAYETYRFKRLVFIYESSKSTATNGSVLMAVDFDPDDAAPTNKAQALAYNNAIRGPTWETFSYVCSPGDLSKLNQKFIRFGALNANQDPILYDVGNLFICPSGLADGSAIGELHVDYEVEMYTPQFDLTAYALSTAAKYTAVGAITNTNWLGTSITQIGGVSATYTASTLFLNIPGQYILIYTLTGTSIGQTGSPTFSSTGNTITLLSGTNAQTQLVYVLTLELDTPANGISVTNLTSSYGTLTGATLRIGYYAVSLA
jgi:hypothetical protein